MDLSKFANCELKSFLRALNKKTSGNKQELLLRLQGCEQNALVKVMEKCKNNTTQADELLDLSQAEASGDESLTKLRSDVAGLKDSVSALVQQVQMVLARVESGVSLPLAGAGQTNTAASMSLPSVSLQGPNAAVSDSLPLAAGVSADNAEQLLLPSVNGEFLIGARSEMLQGACSSPRDNAGPVTMQVEPGDVRANAEATTTRVQFTRQAFVENASTNDDYAVPANYSDRQSQLSMSNAPPSTVRSARVDVRDMIRIMPEFCPGKGLSSVNFIERINQLSRAYGWCDQMVLYAVYDQLKGPAKQWINAMPIFQQWSEFVHAFLADFPSEVNTAEIHMKMMRTRMNKSESYVDYFYRLLTLGRGGKLNDADIITYIINGMYDDTVKKILSAMHFPRCADLLKTVSTLHTGDKRTYDSIAPGQPMQPLNLKPQTAKPENTATTGLVCYRCRERGHISKNCPKTPKVNCIGNTEVADVTPSIEASINIIAHDNKCRELRKRVMLLGKLAIKCDALIDSGSAKSLVKRSVADKCEIEQIKCSELLVGFAGGEMTCREKIKVEIKFDNASYPAELLIVDDLAMNYDAIIGIDVLKQGTIVIEKGVCRVMPIGSAEIDVGEGLSTTELSCLERVLNSYSHCFGEALHELGKSKRFKMDIVLTSQKPIVKKPYSVPIPKQNIVEHIVDELLSLGIVRPSHSSYASPIVLVKKPNGEHRLCVDFRGLNAVTEKQPWQMPTVDGVLATLADKRVFTTLDMMSGYYQLELEESAKQFTAFVTHHGHFEFCRMPFGLRNAPCAFQRMMSELIAPLNKSVISYVDEVIIATDTVENNIHILKKFLQLVEEEGLTLRLSKCSFLKQIISFLGHQVDGNGVRPGISKTQAIERYPVPGNQTEVRRFLGLAGFFRKFVPQFAMIARPLTTLLKKETEFVWSHECQLAFQQLVQALIHPPILTIYRVEKEHQLHTDASSAGLAAILLQEEGDAFKPVAFYSRACTAAEAKYHAYELEVLAVVTACERFRMFLLGKHFTIVTDCQAISTVKLDKPMVPRVSRWFLKLLEYDHHILHRSGESMRHVDALSRAPTANFETISDVSANVLMITVTDWVSTLQQQDVKIKEIIDILSGVKESEHKKQFDDDYCVKNQRVFRKKEGNKHLLVVPKGMRWRIVKLCHDDVGHPGVDGTMKRIWEHFWFPRMMNFVKGYIKSCIDCSYHREPRQKQCELHGMDIPTVPFQVLHMDHLGPFIKSRRGNEYLLVIVDALSRYSIIAPVKSTKTKPVIDTLNQMTLHFGLPQRLITDRGTAFTSASFEDFCKSHNIQHIKVAVRTPRANGLAERVNQAILNFLKPSTTDQRDWDCHARLLQWTLNTTPNSTTKKAPMDLIYDFPLRDITGNKLLAALHDDVHVQMNERRDEAIHNIKLARQKWKKRFDAKHKKPIPFQEGDLILLESPAPASGESRKLEPKYKGPLVITKVLRYDRYVVEDIDGVHRSKRHYNAVVSSDKMKPWCSLFPDADEEGLSDEEDITRDE